MTGSRLWLQAGQGGGRGPLRTPAAERTPSPSPAPAGLPGAWRLRPGPGRGGGTWMRGPSLTRARKCGSWGWGGGSPGKLDSGGKGSGSLSPGQTSAHWWPHLLTPPPQDCYVYVSVCLRGHSMGSCTAPGSRIPEQGSLAPFCDWGSGEEALKNTGRTCLWKVPIQALDRHIIQCQARGGWLGPGQKPDQGGQDRGCTHPSLGPTHLPTFLGLLSEDPTCSPLPPYLPGICQSHLIPTPSFLCSKDSADPIGPEGS